MSADHSITHIRPRFRFTVPFEKPNVITRIDDLMKNGHHQVVGKIVDNQIILDIPEKIRHYWSPQLNFRVEQDYDNPEHSVVRGLIGPRPGVWTMFMFIYFSIGVSGFILSVYGISHWMLGEHNIWVYALPVAALIMATAYKAGKYGESLGADQIEILKQFVRDALNMKKS